MVMIVPVVQADKSEARFGKSGFGDGEAGAGSGFDHSQVERRKAFGGAAGGEVKRIGEVHAVAVPGEGLTEQRFVLGADVRQRQQAVEGIVDGGASQAVKAAEDPLGFQQDGLGQEDCVGFEQAAGLVRLPRLVAGEQTDDDVSIGCDHAGPAVRHRWRPGPPGGS